MSTTPQTLPAPPALPPSHWLAMPIDKRYLPPLLITLILIAGNALFRGLEGIDKTLLSIGTCIGAEVVLSKVIRKQWPNAASAYISGISIGMLLRSPYYWPYILCALITIGSKYVIRYRGRHIWNPSNFGIAMMVILAHNAVATLSIQWDNKLYVMLVIWTAGAIIIGRLKRFHICLTYVLSFLAFAFLRHLITGDPYLAEIAPITGPMYQLFTFFMITDPPTTVKGKVPQMVVAFLVAAMEFVLRTIGGLDVAWGAVGQWVQLISVHAPYFALFTVGPIALVTQMVWLGRRGGAGAAGGAAGAPVAASGGAV
ncbi:MAG: hypothetical protein IT332_11155 [Ardenticatenales bacterium]|nr:hypothetical protein [Ardenticatenales bacterium]